MSRKMKNAINTPTMRRANCVLMEVRNWAKVMKLPGMETEMKLMPAIPVKIPEITFATPNAPKLTAVAAIAPPRTADETGLEQEKAKAAISAGVRKRM